MGRIVTLWTGSACCEDGGAHRVAGLVVGGELLLLVGQHHRLAALAHEHPVAGVLEVVSRVIISAPSAHGEQRRLVDEVGQIGAAHAGRAAGDDARGRRRGDALVTWRAPRGWRGARRARAAARRPGGRSGRGAAAPGSRMSGRLVAAIITMPSVASKPSISVSIWLSVCSRSSWPPPRPAPRLRPMESISSTKMMARPSLRADWNRSRTRLAPTPTNISMKSEPVTDRNGTPASPATARAMRVLPVPGGPTSSTPLGMRAPISPNFSGYFRKSTTSRISFLTPS